MAQISGVPVLILREGTRDVRGRDARRTNMHAIMAVGDMLKTTLGPRGMDKMLVDSLGDITITNDGATIVDKMDVDNPAAKMAVELAKTQDARVGDGTTTAVVFAGALLHKAEELMDQDIHPAIISRGFHRASIEALLIVDEIATAVDPGDTETLKKTAITTMSSKGSVGNREHFAELAVDAISALGDQKDLITKVKRIKVVKKKGRGILESRLIRGIIIEKEPINPEMPKLVTDAKIAIMAQALEIKKTEFDRQAWITSADQMQGFMDRETNVHKGFADMLTAAGVNVVVNQKGIDDKTANWLAKAGILAFKSISQSDIDLIAKATGGTVCASIKDIDEGMLGYAEKVECTKIENANMVFIEGCKDPKALSILLRAGVDASLDEADRTMHDALCVTATLVEHKAVVAGGGAVEEEIAAQLRDFARKQGGREQMAIDVFADALEVVPATLAENGGLDPIDTLVDIRSRHASPDGAHIGINLHTKQVEDTFEAGILEPAQTIKQVITLATDLASIILRIDDMIMAKKSAAPAMPPGGGMGGGMGGMPPGMGGMGGMGGMY